METLVKNTHWAVDDSADPEIPTATLQIYDFIADYLKRPKDTHVNRASSASMCPKRRWFQRNGVEGTPLTPRKMVNFLLGDLSEKTLNYFIKQGCVGPGKIYSEVDFGVVIGTFTFQGKQIEIYQQQDLTADMGGIEVTAHVDGWGKRNSDGKWELIEIKSASDFGFEKFKTQGPESYLNQSTVNLSTNKAKELGATEVRYFYLRKATGNLYDRVFTFDPELFKQVCLDYKISNQKELPETPYLPVPEKFRGKETGRMVLRWECEYCPFPTNCHKFKVEWKAGQFGAKKPVYVVTQGESK